MVSLFLFVIWWIVFVNVFKWWFFVVVVVVVEIVELVRIKYVYCLIFSCRWLGRGLGWWIS